MLAVLDVYRPLSPPPKLLISGIADHSARVRPGNIFVAIKGFESDGHDFVGQAIAQGAVAVIAEKELTASGPVFIVPDTRIALARLSSRWFSNPAQAMKMIGVTASNGKTTTAFMLDSILSKHYPATGLIGTVVVKDGHSTASATLTTPNSLELQGMLARMRSNGCSHVTMEVSSAAQELERIHGLDFDLALFNNVTREHVDFHGNFQNYWRQKSKLIRNLSATATAILNADEPMILALAEDTAAASITYSLRGNPAPIQISAIDLSRGWGRFSYTISKTIESRNFCLPPCALELKLRVLGLHNVYNAAAAITAGLLCGVPAAKIRQALGQFSGVERRFQLIYDQDFKIIDDHFANPGNIDISLATLGLMKYNRLHLLIAIRGNRGAVVNRENTETLVKWLPLLPLAELIFTDSEDYTGAHDRVSPAERDAVFAILQAGAVKYRHFPRLADAVAAALANAETDDVILMGGCQGLDHAAHIAVPLLAQRFLPKERNAILAILKNRIAGSS